MPKKIMAQHYRGFTIVELLIVIVIIAILAAITLVSYSSIQQRARESRVALQLTQLRKQMEMYKIENGEWPFQADIDQIMAEQGYNEANAWVFAARRCVDNNNASSGATPPNLSGSSTIISYTGSGSKWEACAGFLVSNSASLTSSASIIYISSAKLGVSPVYRYKSDSATVSAAAQWCSSDLDG